jgi:hypothetical protein
VEVAQPVKTDLCKVHDTKSMADLWISP